MGDSSVDLGLVERTATRYFAPPRGLRNMRTHAKLMVLMGIIVFTFSGYGFEMDARLQAEMAELPMALPLYLGWLMVLASAIMCLGGLTLYYEAMCRLGIAATYGFPEPAVGEWPAMKREIARLRAEAHARVHGSAR